jgi:4-amino-4-deoxy-L-arabinose transferase-like glycosyltransferase
MKPRMAEEWGPRIALLAFFVLLAVLILTASLHKKLDHDENQFIASAYVLAKHGLLPYVDYPYFHVPYLIAPYAVLFLLTDHLMVSARLFSAACSLIALALIAWYAARIFSDDTTRTRLRIAAGSLILLAANPLFIYTSGLAWNHDASIMLSLAAAVVILLGNSGARRKPSMVAAGLLLGLAIGTRLTALPLVLPFLAGGLFLRPDTGKHESLVSTAWFVAGITVALLPLLLFFAAAPDGFLFGNFGYPGLNTAYRQASGYTRAMSSPGKLLYFLERAADPGNLLIFVLLGFVIVKIGVRNLWSASQRPLAFALALIGFALAGSLAPTPAFRQYLYALIPFSLLAALIGIDRLRRGPYRRTVLRLFAVAVIICALRGIPSYWTVFRPGSSEPAVAAEIHRLGREIRSAVGADKVLTLGSILPLEGGADIYSQLVTSPFVWRTAHLLSPEQRARLGIVSQNELADLLQKEPPAGVLVGLEPGGLEEPFVQYASESGFRPLKLTDAITIWLPAADGQAR